MPDVNPWTSPIETRKELFDVVLVKEGAHPHSAKTTELKRVTVEASSTLAARSDPKVEAETGWRPFQVTTPGQETPEEVAARQRSMMEEHPPVDRARI
jgi:hypothetical protein